MKRFPRHTALTLLAGTLCGALLLSSCGERNDHKTKTSDINELANKIGRKTAIEDYPKIPGEELLQDLGSNRLFGELQSRYSQQMLALHAAVTADNAKFIVVIMGPDVGKFASPSNTYGISFITQFCTNQSIDWIDLTPDISEWTTVNDPNRAPVNGNWSKAGAAMAAKMLAGAVSKYDDYSNPTSLTSADRPYSFGDLLKPEADEQEGKPKVRMHINDQGLRMGYNITFPKSKQRVLLLGDQKLLTPDLDDDHTITTYLQRAFPDKEFINAGHPNYTIEDYVSLYTDKARYTEPDVVILCTNGGDILDEYFSQRNHFARSGKGYRPTETELNFYKQFTKSN